MFVRILKTVDIKSFTNSVIDFYAKEPSRRSNGQNISNVKLKAIHKGRPADPRGGESAESGRSIVIRVRFYCFIWTQGGGGSRNPGFSRTSFVNGP